MITRKRFSASFLRPVARIGGAIILTGSLLTGCQTEAPEPPKPQIEENSIGLRAFDGCAPLLDYFKEEARAHIEEGYGWGFGGPGLRGEGAMPVAAEVGGGAPQDDGNANGGPAFSGTNNQERGVDEADIIKTDGRYIYSTRASTFYIHRADDLTLLSETAINAGGGTLLIEGDRAVVLSQSWGDEPMVGAADDGERVYHGPKTVLTVLDISNRETPQLIRRSVVDGSLLAARLVGGTIRAAVHFQGAPQIEFTKDPSEPIIVGTTGSAPDPDGAGSEPSPREGDSAGFAPAEEEGEDEAEPIDEPIEAPIEEPVDEPIDEPIDEEEIDWQAQLLEAIDGSTLADWVPHMRTEIGDAVIVEPVTTCGQFY